VIVDGAALAVPPTQHEGVIPGAGPNEVATIRAIRVAYVFVQVVALDVEVAEQSGESFQGCPTGKGVEEIEEVVEGLGHAVIPSRIALRTG
jgi:hypothetical protein